MTDPSPTPRLRSAGATDVGLRRKRNEDAFLVDDERGVYAVADGMGGHASGHVASKVALDAVRAGIAEHGGRLRVLASDASWEASRLLEQIMREAIDRACREVFERGMTDEACCGMGTTVVVLVVAGSRAVVGHVGDSRAYLVRRGGVHQLTDDHTLANEHVRCGLLTEEEAKRGRDQHILVRAVGVDPHVDVDTQVLDLYPGDLLLLSTDGAHGGIEPAEIALALRGLDPLAAPVHLIDLANARGGPDNSTVVVVSVAGVPPVADDSPTEPDLADDERAAPRPPAA